MEPGTWVEFDLKVDEKILRDFRSGKQDLPFTDESSLLKLVNDFYAAVWEREQGYYGAQVIEEPEPANEPEKFPEMAEWMEQNYPEKSKTQQRRYRGDYRVAREAFEARQGSVQPAEPFASNVAVRDGAIRVGKVKAFYSGTCPGFRLGWGSGLFSTTVDMRLDDDSMGEVLSKIDSYHHDTRPTDGPKTRKLVGSDNAPSYPMGWARLEVRG